MTRARNIAGFSTITTTPSPVHVGPIGVLTATRIDGAFNLVDLDTRDITAQGIGVTNLQVSGITTGLNVSGIITAQNGINFNGTSTGLNASGIGTIATLNVTGNATIGGVLTYEDVTNVDSVGIVTARGLSIFGNTTGLQVVSGIATFLDQATAGDSTVDKTAFQANSKLRGFPSDSAQTDRATLLVVSGNRRIGLGASSTAAWIQGSNPGSEGLGGKLILQPGGGYVGINTTSAPSYALDVSGETDTSILLKATGTTSSDDTIFRNLIGGTSGNNYIYFGDSGDSNVGQIRYNHGSDYMSFHASALERVRISMDSIRLNSTAQQIHLATSDGSDNGYLNIGAAGGANNQNRGAQVVFYGNEHSSYPGRCGLLAGNSGDTQGHIYFQTGGSERLRITSAGNLNIGGNYTQTTYTAQVTGTLNATSNVLINGKSAATAGKAIAMAMVFG